MKSRINNAVNRIVNRVRQDQSPNGAWKYPFETGIATDCYMIILLRTLEIHEENLIISLTERIISKQEKNGGWKLFFDEDNGNVSSTLEAYYALLYSGYYKKGDPRLFAAKNFVLANGGITKSHMFTKIMLALTGQVKWSGFFPVPIELILLPTSFPVNFYDFSVFGRANLAPIMILADRKFHLKSEMSPDLSDLLIGNETDLFHFRSLGQWLTFFSIIENGIKDFLGFPSQLHHYATDSVKRYMLSRIESDGTFYGYFSSTFLMIFALISLGYTKTDPIILNAVKGLREMKCEINGLSHMQYTTATVWNTSLINTALQDAGISHSDPMVEKANRYLLNRQHHKYGDWAVHNPTGIPGGWGFADLNTIHPDIDDTTAALRSLSRMVHGNQRFHTSWKKGIQWILSMQNDDGGWSAFEKNTNKKLLHMLPIEGSEFLIADPSTADLTGRTLEFFGSYTNLSNNNSAIKAAVNWLLNHQELNGSWYGRWGICYIYGTWAAITGLSAVGIAQINPQISKAVRWLNEIQHDDGGWGESCKSDSERAYVSLENSTLTHTAWAVDALIAVSDKPTKVIKRGIEFLVQNLDRKDWTTTYPKGQGMGGAFYIHYHSYRYIFPLQTLAHYQNKYLNSN